MERRSQLGTPRPIVYGLDALRDNLGYSDAGMFSSYDLGRMWHDGSTQTANDYTVLALQLASSGAVMVDANNETEFPKVNSFGTTGNYYYNTRDNSTVTGNPADAVPGSKGPMARGTCDYIAASVSAGRPIHVARISQGESDANAIASDAGGIITAKYNQYKAFLLQLIADVRVAAENPKLPIIIDPIGRRQTGDGAAFEAVRQIQREVITADANVFPGSEQYPYIMAGTATKSVTTTSGSNVIACANTSGLSVNQGVRGLGIPSGAFISAISTNVSFSIQKMTNGAATNVNATASGTVTSTFEDPIHIGPSNVDTGYLTSQGYYAIEELDALAMAAIYNAPGAAGWRGPYVSNVTVSGADARNLIVTLMHVDGTDFTLGDRTGMALLVNGVNRTISSVTKLTSNTFNVRAASNVNPGDLVSYAPVYGAITRADPAQFIFDNAVPPRPIQATTPFTFVV